MNKIIPLKIQLTLQRLQDEKQRWYSLYDNKPRASQLTGTLKMPFAPSEDSVPAMLAPGVHNITATELDRRMGIMRDEAEAYRQFAEQFVLRRCSEFKYDNDKFDAVCDAKAIYKMIQSSAGSFAVVPPGATSAVGASPDSWMENKMQEHAHKAYMQGWQHGREEAGPARRVVVGGGGGGGGVASPPKMQSARGHDTGGSW